MDVNAAIRTADCLLPGTPVEDGPDPRWQAIIAVGEHIETEPEAVWEFIRRWGNHPQEDLRAAISTCLLEHLLAHDFAAYFSRMEQFALADPNFAATVQVCGVFGATGESGNAARLSELKARLARHHARVSP